jgi:hypothetical protein
LRTRLIDGVRKMIRQQFERCVRIDPEMLGKLSDMIIAEGSTELVGRHRQICAAAKPGLHLRAESALLQLVHDALQIAKVRLANTVEMRLGTAAASAWLSVPPSKLSKSPIVSSRAFASCCQTPRS